MGICTKNLFNKLFEDGQMSALDKQKFFARIHALYSEAFFYGVGKLPIKDSVEALFSWKVRFSHHNELTRLIILFSVDKLYDCLYLVCLKYFPF